MKSAPRLKFAIGFGFRELIRPEGRGHCERSATMIFYRTIEPHSSKPRIGIFATLNPSCIDGTGELHIILALDKKLDLLHQSLLA